MTEVISIATIVALYDRFGSDNYDEDLSQLAHAEQTAALAVAAGADDALVVAALLHDVGHLLYLGGTSGGPHETTGPAYLGARFGSEVTGPIAGHVEAKRYLCAVDAEYYEALSLGSQRSLARQGGPMTADETTAFETREGWPQAVTLRRWDDLGKVDGVEVAPFASYVPLLERLSVQ